MDLKSGFMNSADPIGILKGGNSPGTILRNAADPLRLFTKDPVTPTTISPAYVATPANPSATPSPQAVAATNATDAAILEQQRRRAAGLNTVMSGASSDSGATNYG